MKIKLGNLTKIRGIAQIPLIVGLLLMAIAIPVATKLSQESAENRGRATPPTTAACKICSSGFCINSNVTHCLPEMNECIYNADCATCTENATQCNFDGSEYWVRKCLSGVWVNQQLCSNGCDGNNCKTVTQVCTPSQCCNGGAGRCRFDGGACEPCEFGCDRNMCRACNPGQIKCQDGELIQCESGGMGWNLVNNCGGYGCSGTSCNSPPAATNTPKPTATTVPCVAIGGTTSSEANCCSKKAVNMGGSVWQCACIPAGGTTTNASYCCSGKSENGKCLAPGCSLGGVNYAVGVKLCYADKSKYRSCASTGWQDVSCGNGTACYDDGAGNVGCATRQTAVCCCTSSNSQRSWYTSACPDYNGWYQCDGHCSSLPTPTPSYCGFVGLPCCNGNSCSGSICDTSTGKCRVIEDPTTFPTNCLSKYSVNQRVCDPLRPQYYNTCLSTGFWSGFIKCIAGTKCNEGVCESCIEDGSLCTAGLFNNCEKCCSNKYHSVSDKNYCGAVPTLVPTKTPVPTSTPTPTPAPGCKNDGVYCVIAGTVNTCNCCTNQYYRAGPTGDAYICGPRPTPTCIADGLSCGGSAASYCDRCCQKDVYYALGQNWFCGTNPNLTSVPTRLPTSSTCRSYGTWRSGECCSGLTKVWVNYPDYRCCRANGLSTDTASHCCSGTASYQGSMLLCGSSPGATAIPTPITGGNDCPAGSSLSCLGKKLGDGCATDGSNLKCVMGTSGSMKDKCECRNPAYLTHTPTPRPTRPPTTGMPTQAPGDKCYCITGCSLSNDCMWFNPARIMDPYNNECSSYYCTTPQSTPRPTVVIPSGQPTAIPTQPLISPGQACRNDTDCGAPTKPGCALQCVTAYCPGNSGCGKTEGSNGALNCQLYPPSGMSWNADYSACVGGAGPSPIVPPPPPPPTNQPTPPAGCGYNSLQARVRTSGEGVHQWATSKAITFGETIDMGCMYDNTGQLASNVTLVAKHSSGTEAEFKTNLKEDWKPAVKGNYTIWCKSTDSKCSGLVSNSNATLSVGSACKECSNEFKCYGPADDKVELGYAWFATGYVMEGWTTLVPECYCSCDCNNDGVIDDNCRPIPKPQWLGKAKGDANCDGKIDTYDFSLWNTEFVSSGGEEVVKNDWEADFTGPDGKCDGLVNTYDFSLWNRSFIELGGGN